MPEELLPPRTVRDFCKYYGLSRHEFLIARSKAKVTPKDHSRMLSATDEEALLRYVSYEKRVRRTVQQVSEQPRVRTYLTPPPPEPIDYDVAIPRAWDSLAKWRRTLIELAREHLSENDSGRCEKCHVQAPCETKQTLLRLDRELVEEIAVSDSGDLEEAPARGALNDPVPEVQLEQLYMARNRWMRALTKLTIEHMLEDANGLCPQCKSAAPCQTKKALTRINRGVARRVERFASMDDAQLDKALGSRHTTPYRGTGRNAM
ncbi:hypothetical protein [Mycobacteroides chelonae]|uniref:hypothetical protein n=1 Tax=Mycobacteroides chelonae TaxID=1774 RepID=UPI0004AAA1CB|nr:hypothetical protein [Mycobacteroides chelonae]MBF9319820.1 hypothetical protein [Mycobacteroides chelonae]OHT73644.1 hypothetical protein BKG66_05005 [Mycobacteroides chelonae]OHT76201.1 hypothetical protein BKG67_01845 [Mycobacteroides chelonae]OHT91492.1 hypothetical protein BKG70_02025 [Mycobacteroides chelonae]